MLGKVLLKFLVILDGLLKKIHHSSVKSLGELHFREKV